MEFDPYLYVALALGVLAGRFLHRPAPRLMSRATVATVVVLVGLLGASLSGVAAASLLSAIPIALGDAGLILGLTAAIFLVLARRLPPAARPSAPAPLRVGRFSLSLGLLGALVVGYGLGAVVPFGYSGLISYALYVLLALIGLGLKLETRSLGHLWLPLTAAFGGALGAALIFSAVSATPLSVSLATSLAFGWYTLAGPLVAARAGAVLGLLAFLVNFLRENLTMLSSPVVGRRMRGAGLTALGGATAMDTTLFFILRYGDEDVAGLALASGLILTVAASLILPAALVL